MNSKKSSFPLSVIAGCGIIVASALLAACGGSDEGPATADGPCTEARSLCATLQLPQTYTGKPQKLLAALYDQLPPVGPPSAVIAMVEGPAIAIDEAYALEAHDIQKQGEFFVYVALYNEGGGPFLPVPGVDYTARTEEKLAFSGVPVNLGEMMLKLEAAP